MFSRHAKVKYGRLIPKPENKTTKDEVELYEEAVPITEQIENLRTKIQLQERYNAALKDNLEESAQGTYILLRSMFDEVFNLRLTLKEAVCKEKWAVNNALRSHRYFQLSLKKASPHFAMGWMDDKIFDNTKLLNEHIDRLIHKRKKLEEIETQVTFLEQCPVPGSLPMEMKMVEKMKRVCVAKTNTKMKLECAKVLYSKYLAIRWKLKDEENLYMPIIRNLTSQLSFQHHELKNLQQMLADAQKFQRDAEATLENTEKSASGNRKNRRGQLGKMRRDMQRMIQAEQRALISKIDVSSGAQQQSSRPSMAVDPDNGESDSKNKLDNVGKSMHNHARTHKSNLYQFESIVQVEDAQTQMNERLAQKRMEIDTFNDTAALLVDIMKIPNLTHIPARLENVIQLNKTLRHQRASKEKLKSHLIKQRDQLSQLFCVIRYAGSNQLDDWLLVTKDYQETLDTLQKKIKSVEEKLNRDGDLLADFQLAISTLMARIDGLEKKQVHIKTTEHLITLLPVFCEKLKDLVDSLNELKKDLLERKSSAFLKRNQQAAGQQLHTVPARYMRVGEPTVEAEGSEDEEFEDYKVPGRLEIKHESNKIIEQGLLRLGIAAQSGKRKTSYNRKKSGSSDAN